MNRMIFQIAITLLSILLCWFAVYRDWRKSGRKVSFTKFIIESINPQESEGSNNQVKPNLKEFLEGCNIKWTENQKELASILIDYRNIHFSGGRRSGRTTVVNAVAGYFERKYPYVEKEI